MLIGLFTALHVAVCLMLILVVLLQKGKGQDFASTFGGGGTQTAFGARSGATILHRATTAAAVIFMLTSLTLTILMSRDGQESVLGGTVAPIAAPETIDIQIPLTPLPGGEAGALPAEEPAIAPEVDPADPVDAEPDQEE